MEGDWCWLWRGMGMVVVVGDDDMLFLLYVSIDDVLVVI